MLILFEIIYFAFIETSTHGEHAAVPGCVMPSPAFILRSCKPLSACSHLLSLSLPEVKLQS